MRKSGIILLVFMLYAISASYGATLFCGKDLTGTAK